MLMVSLAIELFLLFAWVVMTFGMVKVAMAPKIVRAIKSSAKVKPGCIEHGAADFLDG